MTSTEIAMLSAQMGVIMGMSPEHVLERLTLREAFIFLATAEAMSSPKRPRPPTWRLSSAPIYRPSSSCKLRFLSNG